MFSKFVGMLRSLGGRIVVGVDKHGNSYYRRSERGDGGTSTERRWVEFKGTPDTRTIPVEWTSWLSGTRKQAPTPQEVADLEAQRKNMKLQAALIKKEEEKEHFRGGLSREGHQADGKSPNMDVMMKQISSQESPSPTEKAELPHTRYTKVREAKESVEPIAWQPPRQSNK